MYLGGVNIKLVADQSCFNNTGSFNEFLIMDTVSMGVYFFNRNRDCWIFSHFLAPIFQSLQIQLYIAKLFYLIGL